MDAARFDRLARRFGRRLGRRAVLAALTALGVGGSPSAGEDVAAKKKKKKKPCGPCKRRVKGRCKPKPSGTACPGGTCQKGVCVSSAGRCGDGQRSCRGGCIPSNQCCVDGDCTGGKRCQNGSCNCPAGLRDCAGVCLECCQVADCCPSGTCGTGVVCARGTCACSQAQDRYCPIGLCGECCIDDDCGQGGNCINDPGGGQPTCSGCQSGWSRCPWGPSCIPTSCQGMCGARCNPQNENPCGPCDRYLLCDFEPANQNDGYRCRPPG